MSRIDQVPVSLLRLLGLGSVPALPVSLKDLLETLAKLAKRAKQAESAIDGLSDTYTIDGREAEGRQFLYGEGKFEELQDNTSAMLTALEDNPLHLMSELKNNLEEDLWEIENSWKHDNQLTDLSLDDPSQWTISWTHFDDVRAKALPHESDWVQAFSDPEKATELFWPLIAEYGLPYNLLVAKKADATRLSTWKASLGEGWLDDFDGWMEEGRLYAIDLTLFENFKPSTVNGTVRFTPGILVMLEQDATTKNLLPRLVRVSSYEGNESVVYYPQDEAWLYALFAARTALTVYGIWIGHVYSWHLLTAAMQMTFANTIDEQHPLWPLLQPQFESLIGFDDALMLLWKQIAPPTSFHSLTSFLYLTDTHAQHRPFFADDPHNMLTALGIKEEDFTNNNPWDAYPFVKTQLDVWEHCHTYVASVIKATYSSDAEIVNDSALQEWMSESRNPRVGNVQALPEVDSRESLIAVLTSLIFRITVHGCSRLVSSANPGLTYVPNFPPCLQDDTIPAPDTSFSPEDLCKLLPKTGTIGEMMNFYFTFSFSSPYSTLIPEEGVDARLQFGPDADDLRNQALITFRKAMQVVMKTLEPNGTGESQWPLGIET